MFELDTTNEEAVTGVSGNSDDNDGWTFSLEASTTAGRRWGPHGDHTPGGNRSLRKSADAKLRLRFIFGDQTFDIWILR